MKTKRFTSTLPLSSDFKRLESSSEYMALYSCWIRARCAASRCARTLITAAVSQPNPTKSIPKFSVTTLHLNLLPPPPSPFRAPELSQFQSNSIHSEINHHTDSPSLFPVRSRLFNKRRIRSQIRKKEQTVPKQKT